ncbi:glycosyltransferase family 2 protein [Desulfurococcaceae archaeon MEX13E-LK6-19]|nr:glycosyltransferase family 2 protein [Desulfurococcaceae archaeon MEX13E-LK6-19]
MKISIIIPTKNSAKTLSLCLKSIVMQTYPKRKYEVIIVDGYSTDGTIDIAKQYGCKIIFSNKKPLGARLEGLKVAKGDIIVFLDADHIIKRPNLLDDIERTIDKGIDMVHLEEHTFKPRTLIQKLIAADKKTMQDISYRLNPLHGVLYPRVFRRNVVEKAYKNIPLVFLWNVYEHEEAILFYECLKISKKFASIKNALYHVDVDTFVEFFKKISKYGSMDMQVKRFSRYIPIIRRKQFFRLKEIPYLLLYKEDGVKTLILLMLRVIAYNYGKIRRHGL